ncbi:molybdate ABC transporter substrate-binding protein [Marinomonas posidonica]|uniref:Molybdenum ABC transporter, periplasmic molybdate-binding protein n=1 Tax=Marinomonas posidonica (strain CECT 7376 / NCIMB 14433 / IVIA-Po-181) TaxID=491952 RepID=F6CY66_MARPP|nr:molybdate ABC transporter substrate-binding protein [Marinomonas posidonica]AEF55698.1 molybdenum ABC transporter, periplasmic molybdate-binding protein [Marinomonas posidonica IVIA-Po-181]
MNKYSIITIKRGSPAFNVCVLLAFLALAYQPSNVKAQTLKLAVASNFIHPIKVIAEDFKQETGHNLSISFGSSGKLFAQIQHHAPYDVFLSADLQKPQVLLDKGLAQAGSLAIYAKGKLVLWAPSSLIIDELAEALKKTKYLAIANPKLAPYGKAAQQSLQHLGIWSSLENKLITGENIGQTYQFVHSGNVEYGLVALSQTLKDNTQAHIVSIPATFHDPILQAGVILTHSNKIALAHEFMAFLLRPDTQAKLQTFGYDTAY